MTDSVTWWPIKLLWHAQRADYQNIHFNEEVLHNL